MKDIIDVSNVYRCERKDCGYVALSQIPYDVHMEKHKNLDILWDKENETIKLFVEHGTLSKNRGMLMKMCNAIIFQIEMGGFEDVFDFVYKQCDKLNKTEILDMVYLILCVYKGKVQRTDDLVYALCRMGAVNF